MVLRRILLHAARRAATDPAVRAKTVQVLERDVKPRAKAAWAEARPRLETARDEIKEAARTADPRSDPVGFAHQIKRRLVARQRQKTDR